jgi:hypothetical protein
MIILKINDGVFRCEKAAVIVGLALYQLLCYATE